MNIVGNTITIPVWINGQRIYVPSVDIPIGSWTLILRLTPIQNDKLVLDNGYKISSVGNWRMTSDVLRVEEPSGSVYGGQGWRLSFSNAMKQSKGDPVAIRYTICIEPIDRRSDLPPRCYDPVVIAQPDPLYP